MYQDHGDCEYVSIMAFLLGIFWMENRSFIEKCIEKNYFIFLVSFNILMYIFRHCEVIIKNIGITNKYVVYFLLLTNKLNFSNKYLDFLGYISFEVYMIHGLVMHYFGKFFVSSNVNDILYTIVVFCISIISAYYIKKLIIIIEKNIMRVF